MLNPLEILKNVFHYEKFNEPQDEIINSILSKNDTLSILPTGGGKSICYQIPSLIFDGITIVISPLISLMKDQLQQLEGKIKAECLNSFLLPEEQNKIYYKIINKETKLLYVSPEKFISEKFIDLLRKVKVSMFAVDEAHCISEWGHDFRPSYLKVKNIIRTFPVAVVSAFTATATPEVKEDIINKLGLRNTRIFIKGFERKNIGISIIKTKNRNKKLVNLINATQGSTIIYCQSRKEVEEVNDFLRENEIPSLPYHAGMDINSRKTAQDFFQSDKIKIIVATNAFGMGINKSNIRLVIHYSMPGTLENYYQEIGRAGRDGLESEAVLLFKDADDKRIHEYFINQSKVDRSLIQIFYDKLHNFHSIEIGEINQADYICDSTALTKHLNYPITSTQISIILALFEKNGFIRIKYQSDTFFIKMNVDMNDLKKILQFLSPDEQKVLDIIIRTYGNYATKNRVSIHLNELVKDFSLSIESINQVFGKLENRELIELKKSSKSESFSFIKPRVYSEQLPFDLSELTDRHLYNLNKLSAMYKFITTKECRWNYILEYFGEKEFNNYRCNRCDNCQHSNIKITNSDLNLGRDILSTIKQTNQEYGINLICDILIGSKNLKILSNNLNKISTYGFYCDISKAIIKEGIEQLILEEKIIKTTDFYPKLVLTEKGQSEVQDVGIKENPMEINESEEPVILMDLRDNLSLYDRLIKARKQIAKKFSQPVYLICSDDILRELTIRVPKSVGELSKVNGVTERFIAKCGDNFLMEIKDYLKEQRISKAEERALFLPESTRITYNMLKDGNSLVEICEKRNLSDSVIAEHISTLLKNSLSFEMEKILASENINLIKKALLESKSNSIITIKEKLPPHISYSEIRIYLCFRDEIQNKS